MASFNGTNMVFDSEEEQVTYELNKLINSSIDPQFTDYLKDTLEELKNDPSRAFALREKIIKNYETYAKRMASKGKVVPPFYHRAIYEGMKQPEIKSPYSNDIEDNPYTNEDLPVTVAKKEVKEEPYKEEPKNEAENIKTSTIVIKAAIFTGLFMLANYLTTFLSPLVSNYLYNSLNYKTFVGKLLFLSIFGTLLGNYYFWILTILSNFLLNKTTTIIAMVWVAIINAFSLSAIYDWVFLILWIIQLGSMFLPLLIHQATLSEKKKNPGN